MIFYSDFLLKDTVLSRHMFEWEYLDKFEAYVFFHELYSLTGFQTAFAMGRLEIELKSL